MRIIAMLICLIVFAGPALAATKESAKSSRPAASKTPTPLKEQLTCRTGPNDKQARLVVVVVQGRPMEFAYYSRLGTRVCSIYGWRGDAYTKWEDANGKARIQLLKGSAEVEYEPGHLKLTFTDVNRMQYCGMYGELNGVVEVTSGSSECRLAGVFD